MLSRPSLGIVIGLSAMLSGCGEKATGQTVAVVNGEEVSASELNAELAAANVPEGVDKKAVMPQLLQTVIDRRLLAQKASEQGLDKTPEYVSRQRRMNEELLINMASGRQADSMKLPSQREIDDFIAANPGMFQRREILTLDQLQFQAPTDRAALQRLSNDHSLDALASSLTSLGIAFARTSTKMDTGSVPTPVMKQIEALPAGEPFIVPIGGKMYASVITGRAPANVTPEESRRRAVEAIRRQNLNSGMQKQLKELRAKAKIEYQPGYAPADTKTKAGAAAVGAR
jgi:EpsD family peptidyl-prolyl cis-trans isomerase